MWEISASGNASYGNNWNSDNRGYNFGVAAFLRRGGKATNELKSGLFDFNYETGCPFSELGFRVCVTTPN